MFTASVGVDVETFINDAVQRNAALRMRGACKDAQGGESEK